MTDERIDPSIPPSGTGCVECLAGRRGGGCTCAAAQSAAISAAATPRRASTPRRTQKARTTTSSRSFEPGEDWFWDYTTQDFYEGPRSLHPGITPRPSPSPARREACRRIGSDTSTDGAAGALYRSESAVCQGRRQRRVGKGEAGGEEALRHGPL